MDKEETQAELNKKRQKCEIYTRVMGYMRPRDSYNRGKKSEFDERKYFNMPKTFSETMIEETVE